MAHAPIPDERYPGPDDRRRRRRGAWWLPLLLLLLLLALAGILAAVFAGGDDSKSSSESGSTTGAVAGASTSDGSSSAAGGRLTANGTNLLPLAGGSLTTRVAQHVQAQQVRVVGVPGDEVFWVGNASKRVLVHLKVRGESGPKVRPGDLATFTGTLQRNTADAASDYGVTAAEGASLLQREGVHVEADVGSLKLSR